MFGFVFGTLCLAGFVGVLRHRGWHRRHWARYGYGPGYYGGYGHGCGGGRLSHFGPGAGAMFYRAFAELDTSPGQEKAIRSALGDLRDSLFELRSDLRGVRGDVARSIAAEQFDQPELEAALERHAASIGRIRPVFAGVLARIHEVLDPDQRRRLARMVESGPGYCV
jgi:uncharacterized membrane protein